VEVLAEGDDEIDGVAGGDGEMDGDGLSERTGEEVPEGVALVDAGPPGSDGEDCGRDAHTAPATTAAAAATPTPATQRPRTAPGGGWDASRRISSRRDDGRTSRARADRASRSSRSVRDCSS
jgi:hypothetical protein